MNEIIIPINVKEKYDVLIKRGLLSECGRLISGVTRQRRIAVVSDSTVAPLYGEKVIDSLKKSSFEVVTFTFPAGEKSKNMNTISEILEFFAENKLTRDDCAVALGGGVTGDMTGFASGCYMRGISFIQIPTTLLAAVDSSVGGKTGVNLNSGKNLAGLFHQPLMVICDPDCLNTLDDNQFSDGAAEAVKAGILGDTQLFNIFESKIVRENISEVIQKSVSYKNKIVSEDEYEHGNRKLLNLGHTAGHAIEKLSDYKISHGMAVSIGMAIISKASSRMGYCSEDCSSRIRDTLVRNGLPVKTSFSPDEIAAVALSDKKRKDDMISIIIPEEIGRCRLMEIQTERLAEIFRLGME